VKLNSYDDWSPLREVILGSAANYAAHQRDLSFDLFFFEQLLGEFHDASPDERYRARVATANLQAHVTGRQARWPIKQRYVEELGEDVEQIADVLKSFGVTVHRPMALDRAAQASTLEWSAQVVPPLNVRDNTLILGDEILETAPQVRSRVLENQFLTPVFADYFRQGARWTVMPRPLMTDASFDRSYARDIGGSTLFSHARVPSAYDVGHEMMIDGAQCLRLGRDLVVNIANANHALACDWLERHLHGRFRIHRVHRLADNHIDSLVLTLRPGLLLVRTPDVLESLPKQLRRWDTIVSPEPRAGNFPDYEDDDLILASRFIDLNVLSLGPDTVMVNDACPELSRVLERKGFTVIPVRHRHRRLFGGGLHCFTLDTVREGSAAEDYLGG